MKWEDISDKSTEIVISALLIGLSLFVGAILDNLNGSQIIIALMLIVLVTIGNALIISLLIKSRHSDELNRVMQQLQDLSNTLVKAISPEELVWLRPWREMDSIERNAPADTEIWVISPDLSNDTGEASIVSEVQASVRNNVKRGIKYVFILPDTEHVWGALDELKKVFAPNPNSLVLRIVNPDRFKLVSDTHILIINPRCDGGRRFEAYLELPIEERTWWVKLSNKYTTLLVGRVQKIVDQEEVKYAALNSTCPD